MLVRSFESGVYSIREFKSSEKVFQLFTLEMPELEIARFKRYIKVICGLGCGVVRYNGVIHLEVWK